MIHNIHNRVIGGRHKGLLAFTLVIAAAAWGNFQAYSVGNDLKSSVQDNCVIIEQLKQAARENAIAQNEIRQTIKPFSTADKARFQTDTNTAVKRFTKRDCNKVPPKTKL